MEGLVERGIYGVKQVSFVRKERENERRIAYVVGLREVCHEPGGEGADVFEVFEDVLFWGEEFFRQYLPLCTLSIE